MVVGREGRKNWARSGDLPRAQSVIFRILLLPRPHFPTPFLFSTYLVSSPLFVSPHLSLAINEKRFLISTLSPRLQIQARRPLPQLFRKLQRPFRVYRRLSKLPFRLLRFSRTRPSTRTTTTTTAMSNHRKTQRNEKQNDCESFKLLVCSFVMALVPSSVGQRGGQRRRDLRVKHLLRCHHQLPTKLLVHLWSLSCSQKSTRKGTRRNEWRTPTM